jgi:hypothetical protein
MKKINIILVLLSLVALNSCAKKEAGLDKATLTLEELLKQNSQKVDANIVISANSTAYSLNSPSIVSQIDINAYFKNSDGKHVALESFDISKIRFTPDEGKNYLKTFSKGFTPNEFEAIKANLLGNEATIELLSSEFGSLKTNFYIPKPMTQKLEIQTLDINRNSNFKVKWEVDTKLANRNSEEEYVACTIHYQANYGSNRTNNNLPRENSVVYKAAKESTGEIEFTSNELSKLPTGSKVILTTLRGSQSIVNNSNNKSIAITAINYCSSNDLNVK